MNVRLELSVIVCTHNPRPDYLVRTLDALRNQTLPKEQWELLLIDNASKVPLETLWNLSWHLNARHVHEGELGLTPARMRGIREAAGEVLVFVDDDNVLAADFLISALKLTHSYPWVGAFGGNVVGEFESQPESCIKGVVHELTFLDVKQEAWACCPGMKAVDFSPVGAGMVIRRNIATYYAQMSSNDPLRHGLDRKGASLVSAGDVDMALCSCAMGFAVGRFPQLYLTHLIPSSRLKRDYLLRLVEAKTFSSVILNYIWDGSLPASGQNQEKPRRLDLLNRAYRLLKRRLRIRNPPSFDDDVKSASSRGVIKAVEILQSQQKGSWKKPV